jgi:hypothetical protein
MDKVSKKSANSGKIQYGDPVTLYETSRSKKVMIPFFIPRSDGSELAIKLQTYKKGAAPFDWAIVEEKSLSLDGQSSLNLLKALKNHLITAEIDEEGEYVMIKLNGETSDLKDIDSETLSKAIAGVLSRDDIIEHLTSKDLSNEMVSAFKSAIRLREMQDACAQLRNYLETGQNDESIYQDWCDNHSWVFGNAYLIKDDVRAISEGDKIDMLLPTVISGYRDIIELKKPSESVLNWDSTHNNHYFASPVSKAIGQCHRYIDVFQEVAIKGLRDNPEIVAYHPRAIIVIGRSNTWEEDKFRALHGLNARLANITVMTYDQLLRQGERLIGVLTDGVLDEEQDEDDDFLF